MMQLKWGYTMNIDELYLDKLARICTTEKQRYAHKGVLRNVITALTEPQFTALVRECIHTNHLIALQEYLKVIDNEYLLSKEKIKPKGEQKRLTYLKKMYRKTLTNILTSLEPDGYSPEVVEWLVLNDLWSLN